MANKVDIRKLIKKKYGEDTLDLPDLLEEIDLVLNEMYDYGSKHNTTDILPISEDPKQSIRIANAVNGNSVPLEPEVGAPRNARPDSDQKRWYHADKIAEADGESKSKSETFNIQVPDIFSLISNSQMEVNSNDYKLVQKMVRNLQTEKGNWILRIQKINEFTQTAQNPVETKDIRKAISALIFLNLLKKLSFFVAQPGKLFEYILRPLIGTDAKVLGSVDQQIVDVTKESQGQIWDYSLKMFTGKESAFTVKGSKANLQDAVVKRGRPITYIVSVSSKEKYSLEFSELLVTTIPEHLPVDEWKNISTLTGGLILVKDGAIGVLIQTKENTESLLKYEKVGMSPEAQAQASAPKQPKEQTIKIGKKNYTVENANQEISELKSNSQLVAGVPDNVKLSYLSPTRAGISVPVEEKQFISALDNILAVLRKSTVIVGDKEIGKTNIPNINMIYDTAKGVLTNIIKIQDPVKKIGTISDILQKSAAHQAALENALENAKKELSAQPQQTELQEANEAPAAPVEKERTDFSIPLKGVWQSIPNKISLNLGNPQEYNKHQLTIASEVANNMKLALDAFQDLSINLVNFFATSNEQAKEGDYGTKVIENANTISANVSAFKKAEGDTQPEDDIESSGD
jgi:hypothetical protein